MAAAGEGAKGREEPHRYDRLTDKDMQILRDRYGAPLCYDFEQLVLLLAVNREIHNTARAYQPYADISADGQYILQTEKIEDDISVYASFVIRSATDKTIRFRCYDKYRTMDLKSIAWDAGTNNVTVHSGDVGTIRYVSQGAGGWVRDLGDGGRSTDTWSSRFGSRDDKLSFLSCYLVSFSEILDAEYHIFYSDNSTGRVPGPSDWDIRVMLKVKTEDIPMWLDGYSEISPDAIDFGWWAEIGTDDVEWMNNMKCYKRPESRSYLVVFVDEGILLKRITVADLWGT